MLQAHKTVGARRARSPHPIGTPIRPRISARPRSHVHGRVGGEPGAPGGGAWGGARPHAAAGRGGGAACCGPCTPCCTRCNATSPCSHQPAPATSARAPCPAAFRLPRRRTRSAPEERHPAVRGPCPACRSPMRAHAPPRSRGALPPRIHHRAPTIRPRPALPRRLTEFYTRFKGQRAASFERVYIPAPQPSADVDANADAGAGADADAPRFRGQWVCTLSLSGGRISDTQPLPSGTFEVGCGWAGRGPAMLHRATCADACELALGRAQQLQACTPRNPCPGWRHVRACLPMRACPCALAHACLLMSARACACAGGGTQQEGGRVHCEQSGPGSPAGPGPGQ